MKFQSVVVASLLFLSVVKLSQTEATAEADNNLYETKILPIALWNVNNSSHDSLSFQIDDMIFTGIQLRHSHYCSRKVYSAEVCDQFTKSQMWPMPVPYKFESGFKPEHLRRFKTAIRRFEENTCVRFRETNNSTAGNGVHVKHVSDLDGCSSDVGFQSPCDMELCDDCFNDQILTLEHELLHVLGVVHEQSRMIRAKYVEIYLQNLENKTLENNFDMVLGLEDTTPYDYGSVMHYPSNAFGKSPNAETIRPRDPNYYHTMGQRRTVTFNDWKKINSVYCAERCPKPNFCKNGGYRNPNDCATCVCPTVFHGKACEQTAKNPLCRDKTNSFTAKQTEQTMILKPLGKNNRTTCIYKISAKQLSGLVNVAVKSDQPVKPKSFTCQDNYVELRHKKELSTIGPRYCGGKRMEFTSEGRDLYLIVVRDPKDTSTYQLSYKQTK